MQVPELCKLIKVGITAPQISGSRVPRSLACLKTLGTVRHEVHMLNCRGSSPFGGHCLCADIPPSRSVSNAWYDQHSSKHGQRMLTERQDASFPQTSMWLVPKNLSRNFL